MDLDEPKKRSLGKLRKAPKTKPRSPNMAGTLRLQRHTAAAILQAFPDDGSDEVFAILRDGSTKTMRDHI
jgi:hypothetical protein